eukprot:COSAG05_NODE_37_length_27688_cov_18.080394_23_plen_276_part_00
MASAQANGSYRYISKLQASWDEQRLYIDKALSSLEDAVVSDAERGGRATVTSSSSPPPLASSSSSSPSPSSSSSTGPSASSSSSSSSSTSSSSASALARAIRAEFAAITAPAPTPHSLRAHGMLPVAPAQWEVPITLSSSSSVWSHRRGKKHAVTIAFNVTNGALSQMIEVGTGRHWASPTHLMGDFGYRSHSFDEWREYMNSYSYRHGGEHPHRPAGRAAGATCEMMNHCQTVGKLWRYPITGMWRNDSAAVVSGVDLDYASDLKLSHHTAAVL